MTIRRLPETVINRIAAGEVVERPASAVKELVENSLDAGASHIEVALRDGGKSLIAVTDDGSGMTADDMSIAIERHATSKLTDDDLFDIHTMGFRGEALPSLGAVSRMTITSRPPDAESAWAIQVEGGRVGEPAPAAHPPGTRVEIRDLFYATPARLKFLKSDRAETSQILDVVKRLAMARPPHMGHLQPAKHRLHQLQGQGSPSTSASATPPALRPGPRALTSAKMSVDGMDPTAGAM